MAQKARRTIDGEDAQAIALQALSFLIAEPTRLARFVSLTGLGPSHIRQATESPSQLASTLEYLLADESLLLAFCQESRLDPATIGPALHVLTKAAG